MYTNSYTNFVTRELCLRNGLAGINHSVQWENKLTLLHKNFDFSKNAVRNFNFILGYTIFTLISIILKSFKKKSRLNFSFYSIIFLTLIILKPALESTNSDLQSQLRKCFTKDFFSVEVLDLCYRLHDSYHHYQDCLFAISVLKYKSYSKFYQMLLLLSGDISLNPGPTPNSVSQSFWKPFENKGLHFLHLNINSILPKLDELKTIAGNTKAAIIGITESKVDNSISDSEVEIPGYCILRCDRNRNGGGVACYVRQDLCFNLRSTAMGDIEGIFFDILLPKTKPVFVGIIYRPPTCINFLECFNKHLDDINLENEIFQYKSFS